MSTDIISGASSDLLTIDATSKAARVSQYDAGGTLLFSSRQKLYRGWSASFRTLGSAATPQNLWSIENQTGSGRVVALRDLRVVMDATAVLTAVSPQFDVSRPTAVPTGGTALTKGALDNALTSHANIVLRGATASDGGGATAITATAGALLWRTFQMRLHTAVGQILPDQAVLLPASCLTDPVLIAANEALLVQVTGTAGSNAATNHYMVLAQWDEY